MFSWYPIKFNTYFQKATFTSYCWLEENIYFLDLEEQTTRTQNIRSSTRSTEMVHISFITLSFKSSA
jgi:hypothetical protein